jgi:hypothetical protein
VPFVVDAATGHEYQENVRPLRRARQIWELEKRKMALREDLAVQRYRRKHSGEVSDEVISQLVDDIADLQRRIDELGAGHGG